MSRERTIVIDARVDVRDLCAIVRFYERKGKRPRSRAALLALIVEDFAAVVAKHGGVERPESILGARRQLIVSGYLDDTGSRVDKRRGYMRELPDDALLDLLDPQVEPDPSVPLTNPTEDAVARAIQLLENE